MASTYFSIFFCVLGTCAIASDDLIDKAFGNAGIVITNFGMHSGTINRVVPSIHIKVQPDGKILMIGDSYKNLFSSEYESVEGNITLVRYNTDGTLDTSFGINGMVVVSLAKPDSYGFDIALQNDGKIVAVGRSYRQYENMRYEVCRAVILRFNQNGTFDTTFGKDGVVIEEGNEYCWKNFFRIAIQNDGKIVAIGNQGGWREDPNTLEFDYCTWFVTRYNADGSPDTAFGKNGKLNTVIRLRSAETKPADEAYSLAIQSDDKIVVVGASEDASQVNLATSGSTSLDCALARYEQSGKLDAFFGSDRNGTIVWNTKNKNFLTDIALQPDNKIVVIGTAHNDLTDKDELLIARYTTEGLLDNTFGEKGIVLAPVGDEHMYAKNFLVQKNGKILITGVASWNGIKKFTLLRYTANGILDTAFGKGGVITTSIRGMEDKSFAVAQQEDEKIIVAGDSLYNSQYDFALVRYNAL